MQERLWNKLKRDKQQECIQNAAYIFSVVQAQSKALLLKNWHGYPPNGGNGSFAGVGRNVMENYGADSGEGYESSSSATPFYSWGVCHDVVLYAKPMWAH